MLGFEPQIYVVGSDRSANGATTTAQPGTQLKKKVCLKNCNVANFEG